ncbi:hypothetical protein [Vibrio parahaemolyticus]|uniref:hypothetical protein n=7 Tax=Vibrio TaxID=662 RepID=UPI001A309C0D|nr:hypothetical protein [Vibrio parahaemolyticus]MCC3845789.1 hypothetical protein [Vibrio parahaemolyticus]HAS6281795.1 hypothetical protein [Vibrio vulnificus]HDY7590041.1 hypothetical protein [Vibrio vulnificus]
MTATERTTISLSFIALLLSAITMYFQFWHEEKALNVSVLDVTYIENKNTLVFEMAFVNSGTTPYLVTRYDFSIRNKSLNDMSLSLGRNSRFDDGLNNSFMVKPQDMVTKNEVITLHVNNANQLLHRACLPAEIDLTITVADMDGYEPTSIIKVAEFRAKDNEVWLYSTTKFKNLSGQKKQKTSDGFLSGGSKFAAKLHTDTTANKPQCMGI